MATCISFLRVPDIAQTIGWYEAIGFTCVGTHREPGCELDWALLDWEGAQFMLYPEGKSNSLEQKDAGLYFTVKSIEEIVPILKKKATIVEVNPKTAYGMEEVVFHDINGFQVTFGCEPSEPEMGKIVG